MHYYQITIYVGPSPTALGASKAVLPKIVEIPAPPHNWVEPPPGQRIFVMTVPTTGEATLQELK